MEGGKSGAFGEEEGGIMPGKYLVEAEEDKRSTATFGGCCVVGNQ